MNEGKKEVNMMAEKMESAISLVVVGDVLIDGKMEFANGTILQTVLHEKRKQPESAFSFVSSFLKKADLRFCNLEGPLSDLFQKGTIFRGRGSAWNSDSTNVAGLKYAGFDVVSLANNQMMSYGWEGAAQTIRNLEKNGIAYIGAGNNLKEATQPKVFQLKNVKIGFLAYYLNNLAPGIPPIKSRATEDKPGLAEMVLSPLYPPPQVNRQHMELFKESIKEARAISDVVVVACHWGVQGQTIAIHQPALAHIAIDSGADLVIGAHPHNIQGVEVYKKKVIVYSLGNFVFDAPLPMDKASLLLQALISDKKIQKVSFRPVLANSLGQAEILGEDNENSIKIFRTLESLSREFDTKLAFQNGEIMISS